MKIAKEENEKKQQERERQEQQRKEKQKKEQILHNGGDGKIVEVTEEEAKALKKQIELEKKEKERKQESNDDSDSDTKNASGDKKSSQDSDEEVSSMYHLYTVGIIFLYIGQYLFNEFVKSKTEKIFMQLLLFVATI